MLNDYITVATIDDQDFSFIRDLVYERAGIFLAPHKKIMVQSRLNSRLRANQLKNFKDYVEKLKKEKVFFDKEVLEIINKITTNKTDFFRENHHFDYLKETYFPFLEKKKSSGSKVINIWSSACSTGEEPYSLAITCAEYFETKKDWTVKIIASDIDTNVLETAKKGIYKKDRLEVVPPQILLKYFKSIGTSDTYEVSQKLKDMIMFQKVNLQEHPYPFRDKFNIIFCRNVIIYFDKPTQKRLFNQFDLTLLEDGLLIIGHSETLFGISDSFKFLGHTVYCKKSNLDLQPKFAF